jgi:hypothetical protein
MGNEADRNEAKVRLNTIISGEPAEWLMEWKRRGLVLSNTEAVILAFRALHKQIVEDDLKNAERKTIMRNLREK